MKRRSNFEKIAETLMLSVAVILIAGLTHIVSVLLLPALAPRDAFARLMQAGNLNELAILPLAKPDTRLIPYSDPSTAVGLCRYDISSVPLRLNTDEAGDGFMSFSFHDRFGQVFYSVTDKAAIKGHIEIVVFLASQRDKIEADDNEEEAPQELRVEAPSQEGYVLIRTLAERAVDMADAEQKLRTVECSLDNK